MYFVYSGRVEAVVEPLVGRDVPASELRRLLERPSHAWRASPRWRISGDGREG